jgi:hypothetical protein
MNILVICYHSVQNRLSFCMLPKNINTKKYRNVILPVVLYGCETWSIILREEHKLRVFENRVLRRIFGPKGTHTRTSLTSESGWARVPTSQTRPCVEWHKPEFGRLYIYRYIHIHIYPSLAPESSSPRRTREPGSYVYGHLKRGKVTGESRKLHHD